MKIAFLGDLAFVGKYNILSPSFSYERFEYLKEILKDADYIIGNLESPLTNKKKTKVAKSIHVSAPTDNYKILKHLNINAVSLSNNHINDFNEGGIIETINVLDSNNIEWFGIDNKDLVFKKNNNRINISGYSCLSTNPTGYKRNKNKLSILTYDEINKKIVNNTENGLLSILSLHWGLEHTNYPNPEHVSFAKKVFHENQNADIVIYGHHPHVIQGIYREKKSVCAFSLGNAVFDDIESLDGKKTLNQNNENKESFVWFVEIKNNEIVSDYTVGFKYDFDGKVIPLENNNKINKLSQELEKYNSFEYKTKRMEQFNDTIKEKFGKKNLIWLLQRLNYNSIVSYIKRKRRRKHYLKITKKFYE